MKGILGYDSTYCIVLAGRLPCPQFLRSGKVKNIFQKIALQAGQISCFCHGYQEGVFLSLIFDN